MSYPHQDKVADKMQTESLKAIDKLGDKAWGDVQRCWLGARRDMRALIVDTYHTHFEKGKASIVSLKATGAHGILSHGLYSRIDRFKRESWTIAKTHLNEIYKQSILRHCWILDETTPPNVVVRIPYRQRILESGAAYYKGAEASAKLGEKWALWSDGYYSALMNNLQLGALNESSAQDAADEVDATRVNTPSNGIMDALQRLFSWEQAYATNNAISTVTDVNEESDVVQIWETRRNTTVCDDCDANEGFPEEECDGDIPYHPNCNCYWRIVPRAWSELLRSGDDNDYATAIAMDSAGLVPNAMAILDEDGKLGGYVTVDFGDWMDFKMHAVSAR